MIFFEQNYPCQPEDLKYFTDRNIKIPEYYKQFLVLYNGGRPVKNIIEFKNSKNGTIIGYIFGFIKDRLTSLPGKNRTYAGRIPRNTLAIAYDCLGNLILMSVSGPDYGKIYFWDHEMEADDGEEPTYDNLTLVADSFEEFINNLKSEDAVDV